MIANDEIVRVIRQLQSLLNRDSQRRKTFSESSSVPSPRMCRVIDLLSSYIFCRPKQSNSRNLGLALDSRIQVQCISSPVPVGGSIGPDRDLSCRWLRGYNVTWQANFFDWLALPSKVTMLIKWTKIKKKLPFMMVWCEAHFGDASGCLMQEQQGTTNPDPQMSQCSNHGLYFANFSPHQNKILLPIWYFNGYILP